MPHLCHGLGLCGSVLRPLVILIRPRNYGFAIIGLSSKLSRISKRRRLRACISLSPCIYFFHSACFLALFITLEAFFRYLDASLYALGLTWSINLSAIFFQMSTARSGAWVWMLVAMASLSIRSQRQHRACSQSRMGRNKWTQEAHLYP